MLLSKRSALLALSALLLACAWVALERARGMGSGQSSADIKGGTAEKAGAQASRGGGASSGPPPEKVGAGLILTCEGQVLLLQRAGKHNHGTWGLPGGNADTADADLLATARREAQEEMGPDLPPFEVLAELLTKRGKRLQKHYTVFVARITPAAKASWQPRLNEEHSDWRWFPLAAVAQGTANPPLHPVVALALQTPPHRQAVLAAVGSGSSGARGGG